MLRPSAWGESSWPQIASSQGTFLCTEVPGASVHPRILPPTSRASATSYSTRAPSTGIGVPPPQPPNGREPVTFLPRTGPRGGFLRRLTTPEEVAERSEPQLENSPTAWILVGETVNANEPVQRRKWQGGGHRGSPSAIQDIVDHRLALRLRRSGCWCRDSCPEDGQNRRRGNLEADVQRGQPRRQEGDCIVDERLDLLG